MTPGSLKFLTGKAPLLHQGSHAGVSHLIRRRIQLSVAKLFPGAGNKLRLSSHALPSPEQPTVAVKK